MNESWPPERGLERLIFFSDAVFAIAITLLVIDLRLPDLPSGASTEAFNAALAAVLPRVLAYGLSFAVIGLYWLAHWRRYHWIGQADGRLAALNLVLLGCVAFLPFPTALVGAYGDRPIVVVIYAVSVSLPGIVGPLTWLYAARAGLVSQGTTPEMIRFGALRGLAVPLVMLSSLALLPFVSPFLVQDSWTLIFLVQWLIIRRYRPRGVPPA